MMNNSSLDNINNDINSYKILDKIASSPKTHYLVGKKSYSVGRETLKSLEKSNIFFYLFEFLKNKFKLANRYKETQLVWMKHVKLLISDRKAHQVPLSKTDMKIILNSAIRLGVISSETGKILNKASTPEEQKSLLAGLAKKQGAKSYLAKVMAGLHDDQTYAESVKKYLHNPLISRGLKEPSNQEPSDSLTDEESEQNLKEQNKGDTPPEKSATTSPNLNDHDVSSTHSEPLSTQPVSRPPSKSDTDTPPLKESNPVQNEKSNSEKEDFILNQLNKQLIEIKIPNPSDSEILNQYLDNMTSKEDKEIRLWAEGGLSFIFNQKPSESFPTVSDLEQRLGIDNMFAFLVKGYQCNQHMIQERLKKESTEPLINPFENPLREAIKTFSPSEAILNLNNLVIKKEGIDTHFIRQQKQEITNWKTYFKVFGGIALAGLGAFLFSRFSTQTPPQEQQSTQQATEETSGENPPQVNDKVVTSNMGGANLWSGFSPKFDDIPSFLPVKGTTDLKTFHASAIPNVTKVTNPDKENVPEEQGDQNKVPEQKVQEKVLDQEIVRDQENVPDDQNKEHVPEEQGVQNKEPDVQANVGESLKVPDQQKDSSFAKYVLGGVFLFLTGGAFYKKFFNKEKISEVDLDKDGEGRIPEVNFERDDDDPELGRQPVNVIKEQILPEEEKPFNLDEAAQNLIKARLKQPQHNEALPEKNLKVIQKEWVNIVSPLLKNKNVNDQVFLDNLGKINTLLGLSDKQTWNWLAPNGKKFIFENAANREEVETNIKNLTLTLAKAVALLPLLDKSEISEYSDIVGQCLYFAQNYLYENEIISENALDFGDIVDGTQRILDNFKNDLRPKSSEPGLFVKFDVDELEIRSLSKKIFADSEENYPNEEIKLQKKPGICTLNWRDSFANIVNSNTSEGTRFLDNFNYMQVLLILPTNSHFKTLNSQGEDLNSNGRDYNNVLQNIAILYKALTQAFNILQKLENQPKTFEFFDIVEQGVLALETYINNYKNTHPLPHKEQLKNCNKFLSKFKHELAASRKDLIENKGKLAKNDIDKIVIENIVSESGGKVKSTKKVGGQIKEDSKATLLQTINDSLPEDKKILSVKEEDLKRHGKGVIQGVNLGRDDREPGRKQGTTKIFFHDIKEKILPEEEKPFNLDVAAQNLINARLNPPRHTEAPPEINQEVIQKNWLNIVSPLLKNKNVNDKDFFDNLSSINVSLKNLYNKPWNSLAPEGKKIIFEYTTKLEDVKTNIENLTLTLAKAVALLQRLDKSEISEYSDIVGQCLYFVQNYLYENEIISGNKPYFKNIVDQTQSILDNFKNDLRPEPSEPKLDDLGSSLSKKIFADSEENYPNKENGLPDFSLNWLNSFNTNNNNINFDVDLFDANKKDESQEDLKATLLQKINDYLPEDKKILSVGDLSVEDLEGHGIYPLHLAIENNDMDLFDLYKNDFKGDINQLDSDGYSPLNLAASHNNLPAFGKLVASNATINVGPNRESLLIATAKNTDPKLVKERIEISKLIELLDPLSVNVKDSEGSTALHYAVKNGNAEYVDYLLENGANANIKNRQNDTPLSIAIQAGNVGVLRKILKRDPELVAPLSVNPRTAIITETGLLENFSVTNPKQREYSSFVNEYLGMYRNEDIPGSIINHERFLNTIYGSFPLILHCLNSDNFDYLRKYVNNIDLEYRDQNFDRPLFTAIYNKDYTLAKKLIEYSVKTDIIHDKKNEDNSITHQSLSDVIKERFGVQNKNLTKKMRQCKEKQIELKNLAPPQLTPEQINQIRKILTHSRKKSFEKTSTVNNALKLLKKEEKIISKMWDLKKQGKELLEVIELKQQ